MPPELPPERSRFSWRRVVELLAVLFFALVLLGLLFPTINDCKPVGKSGRARRDIMNLVTAIKQYHTEYGGFPLLNAGQIEDESTQARLLRVLQAQEEELNPRKIPFFEAKKATKEEQWRKRKYVSGIHPESGAFVDPWGRPYRIRMEAAYTDKIESPYKGGEELRTSVLVWSLGEDGVQGSPGRENILKDSDDVVSWR